jgi:hypothetical protein
MINRKLFQCLQQTFKKNTGRFFGQAWRHQRHEFWAVAVPSGIKLRKPVGSSERNSTQEFQTRNQLHHFTISR